MAHVLLTSPLVRVLPAPATFPKGKAVSIGYFPIGIGAVGGVGATRTLAAPDVTRTLKGVRMPNAGDYLPYSTPGEIQPYSIDFGAQIPPGDSIVSVSSTLIVAEQVRLGFSGSDPNPSENLIGSASFFGTVCTQKVGPLLPNVVYLLTFVALTAAGRTLINYAHICCQAPS